MQNEKVHNCIASTPTKPQQVYISISEDEWSIIITRNHSEISIIEMKHHSVVTLGKVRRKLDKYQR